MSDNERTWYYADKPSPLHDAIDKVNEQRRAAIESVKALETELRAEAAVSHGDRISGFTFPQDLAPTGWKRVSELAGRPVFAPKRTSTANRQLAAAIGRITIPSAQAIVSMCGLSRSTIDGRYMYRTVVGWRDNRIFIGIPKIGDGDPMPEIPDWLTECPAWAKDKFIETGEA